MVCPPPPPPPPFWGKNQTRGYSRAQGLGLAVRNHAPSSQPAVRNRALPLHLAVRNRPAIFFD